MKIRTLPRRILTLALTLTLLLTIALPANADYVEERPYLVVWNSENWMEQYDQGLLSQPHSGQGWSWDPASYTLTLNNVNAPSLCFEIDNAEKQVNVAVIGSNVLGSLNLYDFSRDIYGTTDMPYSIYLYGDTLKLDRGDSTNLTCGTLYIDGASVTTSSQLGARDSMTVRSGTYTVGRIYVWEKYPSITILDGGAFIADNRDNPDPYLSCQVALYADAEDAISRLLTAYPAKDENGEPITGAYVEHTYYNDILECDTTDTGYVSVKRDSTLADYVIWGTASQMPDEPDSPSDALFTDVTESDWFYDSVLWAAENNITSGSSATTFGPNDNCKRGQVVTFLWRAAGESEPVSTANPFTDVSESDYYYKPVLWAVENGITSGKGENRFEPNLDCNRSEVVTFLWRAAGEPAAAASGDFADVTDADWYAEAVAWAVERGITQGKGENRFEPNLNCTRAEVCTFLYRDMTGA